MRKRLIILVIFVFSLFMFTSCDKPVNGKSAYDIAVEHGFKGTEEEWLESLKGEKGDSGNPGTNGQNGSNGKTAYDIAVENGFEGTEEEWLESLKGEKGDSGEPGSTGQTGKGIKSTEINSDGDLIITYTDDTAVNAGHVEATVEDSYLDYYPLPDGTYGISAGKAIYLEEITIPETYNGKAVTRINPDAFCGRDIALKSIIIPTSIKSIGVNAFIDPYLLTKVYYKGSKSQYETILKDNISDSSSSYLFRYTTWYYFTSNGANETASGNWWYYDTDGVTIIEKVIE